MCRASISGLLLLFILSTALADNLSHTEIKELQERLLTAGYPTNGIDGIIGDRTLSAVRLFMGNQNFQANDLRIALEKLRTTQSRYKLVSSKEWNTLKTDIDSLKEKHRAEKSGKEALKSELKMDFANLETESLRTIGFAFIGGIVGVFLFILTEKSKLTKDIRDIIDTLSGRMVTELNTHVSNARSNFETQIEQARESHDQHLADFRNETESEFRSGLAEVTGFLSLCAWKFATVWTKSDYRELSEFAIYLAESSVVKVRKLPDTSDDYLLRKAEVLANAAYYLVDWQNDSRAQNLANASKLINETQDYIGKLGREKIPAQRWGHLRESMIRVYYENGNRSDKLKAELIELMTMMDSLEPNWSKKIKPSYPDFFPGESV